MVSGLRGVRGFTLVELLVVMAIMATLLSIAAPRFFSSIDRAKETALRTDLRILREAIVRYHDDNGHYPAELQTLVDTRYVRAVPIDPMTDSNTSWIVMPHPDGRITGVYDVRSGAQSLSRNGTSFASW